MENSTEIVSFVLAMYGNMGQLKYLYFTLALLFYVSVILANTVLIIIIYLDRNLHEPMYLFLFSLFVNEIYGSTSMLPCLMVHILSEAHDISAFYCFLQIFNIHSYRFKSVPYPLCVALSMYVVTIQPLLNPVMYGLKLSKIRHAWNRGH
ncbi:olfactory receptor 5V1-like [Seriola lalandi dorsalis]|uniref:olfactory receptor 5V1-like n=1 Tax=Seriola lalandi dorsalis TaxID=1841481 RepID=UPI000C6F8133|nr:olfactory receptor 5V1-like [Seriola lalandi dorsalis]